jgi:hypothetical protein
MNLSIEVLEYFARDAEHELTTGQYTPRPVDPQIERDIRVLQAMIHVFRRIHEPRD